MKTTAKNFKNDKKEKKKLGLTTQIFIALLTGALLGVILCYLVPDSSFKNTILVDGILYVLGQGFIRLMKMLVVPLVFCSLVCGSMAIGDTQKLGSVGVRTILFYLVTTALAVAVALTVGNLLNPGMGLDMSTIQTSASSVENMEAASLPETLLNIIPDNPFKSLANGEMLQVIVFALIIGVILAKLGDRAETVAGFISQFNDIMMEMTMMVMRLAPDRRILPHRQNLRHHRFQCLPSSGKIHDRRSSGACHPVSWHLPDSFKAVYRTESSQIYQEILPGNGICLLHCYLKRHHPAVH